MVEDASFTNWAVGSPQEGANLADCAMLQADQVMHKMHYALMPMALIAILNCITNPFAMKHYAEMNCTVIHCAMKNCTVPWCIMNLCTVL